MKLFRESIIIFGIYLIGVFLAEILPLPIPGNVLGLLILFILLCTKIIKVEQIKTVSDFFLDHLAFFFIPAGVGLISSFGIIKEIWAKLLLVCVITTFITMAATGKIVEWVANRMERRGDKNGKRNK